MVSHPVTLRGGVLAGAGTQSGRPAVLAFTEQDFIPVMLAELEDDAGQARLHDRDATKKQNPFGQARFYQPVHRTFNVVVVEAFCDTPGTPRLDPEKIVTAGLCVRRHGVQAGTRLHPRYSRFAEERGWFRKGGRVLGWRPMPNHPIGEGWDPDPKVRKAQRMGHNPQIRSKLENSLPEFAQWLEDSSPLFVAPPEVCKAYGRTYLYGFLPLTSEERSDTDAAALAPFSDAEIAARLPVIFRAARDANDSEPPTGEVSLNDVDNNPEDAGVQELMSMLRYLAQEPGVFPPYQEPDPDDDAAALRAMLRAKIVQVNGVSTPLHTVLEQAFRTFIERRPEAGVANPSVQLADFWPNPTQGQAATYLGAFGTAVRGRWNNLAPDEKRFDLTEARYRLHAFVRLRGEPGCPDRTLWCEPSGVFEIVPWYEGSDAKPHVVELPPINPRRMADMKPNVAFKVPPEIQKFMSGLKLDGLIAGDQPGTRLGFGMICGFSIPILTICAFLVLQIFLALFNILFWWLPFIRICIPFPKIEEESE